MVESSDSSPYNWRTQLFLSVSTKKRYLQVTKNFSQQNTSDDMSKFCDIENLLVIAYYIWETNVDICLCPNET